MVWGKNAPLEESREELKRAFLAFRPTLLAFLASRLGNTDDAHDVAQEAYLRLDRVKDPRLIEKPESYFFQIVKNLSSEVLSRRSASIEDLDLDSLMTMSGDGDGNAGALYLEVRAAIARLDAILDELPPLYRTVLLLRKRDGYAPGEIAEHLGLTKTTVRTYLARALFRCRQAWEDAENND